MHELVAVGNDPEAAEEVARSLDGVCYIGDPNEQRELPFRALVRCVTDNPQNLAPAAGVGLYLGFSRVIRTRSTSSPTGVSSPGVTAIFPLLHHPDLTHEQADAHWRDVHAPLALRHHPGMCDYTQLSVVNTLSGPNIDGFALVSFESVESMKERFFGDDNDRDVIYRDVAAFANPKSPRRVVATETIFGTRPPTATVSWPQG
ncbi:MAG: EthD domain-containing protein [Actinomycetota bacterium]|nr:EthD domain-containing protein [Actinomycetota bacterium]